MCPELFHDPVGFVRQDNALRNIRMHVSRSSSKAGKRKIFSHSRPSSAVEFAIVSRSRLEASLGDGSIRV